MQHHFSYHSYPPSTTLLTAVRISTCHGVLAAAAFQGSPRVLADLPYGAPQPNATASMRHKLHTCSEPGIQFPYIGARQLFE